MIVNKYKGKCQVCKKELIAGDGFAFKSDNKWSSVCNSTACIRHVGLKTIEERKITEDGYVVMPYDPDAIVLLRSLPGAKWEPNTKRWQFSTKLSDLSRVIEIAEQMNLSVPSSFREKINNGTPEILAATKRAEGTYGNKKLYPYQKEAVNFLAFKDRALLADDMGLGKTCCSLLALPENVPVIIISPASVKFNWETEINIWRPEYKVTICEGKNSFSFPNNGEIVIINYDILPVWLKDKEEISEEIKEKLSKIYIIADEFHLVKNYKASRSQKVKQLGKHCKVLWALTGTPLMNRPQDLYGILDAGGMPALGNWNKFVGLFNGYKNKWGGYEFGMPGPEVSERLKRIMLRRLKSDVLKDLPDKVYKIIEVDINSKDILNNLNNFIIKNAINNGLVKNEKDAKSNWDKVISELETTDLPSFEEFSSIRALLAKSRIPAMLEIVESYEESSVPLIVFSAHRAPIDELGNRDGWKVITGDTKANERRDIVIDFQAGKLKGIALTITAGGVGLTLTHASNMLFIDLDWVPGNNLQAEDRFRRISQKANSLLIMHMQSKHPLDRHVQNLIRKKMDLMSAALESSVLIKTEYQSKNITLKEETDEELSIRIKSAEIETKKKYSKMRLEGIIEREKLKVKETPEPELDNHRKDMLIEALEYMLSRCDGAVKRDAIGFSKPDSVIANWVLDSGMDDDLSFRTLERILVRYRRQLKDKFQEIWK